MRVYADLAVFLVVACAHAGTGVQHSEDLRKYDRWSDREWKTPSKLFRPMVRWWWPGGKVTAEGISTELALLDSLGFGGVEIYPFAFRLGNDPAVINAVRTVGTTLFFSHVDSAMRQARRKGMRVDLNTSSGYNLGGALDCADCATHQLLMTEFDVDGPLEIDRALPRPVESPWEKHPVAIATGLAGPFDQNLELIAAVRARLRDSMLTSDSSADVSEMIDITDRVRDGRLRAAIPQGKFRIYAVYRNLTNERLSGAAYPGDPARFRTVDHLDPHGFAAFRRTYFDSLVRALHDPPDHYFVDSFEFLTDVPWTPSFRTAFRSRWGYDIAPYLPLLFWKGGEFAFVERTPLRATMTGVADRVREDYVDLRAQMFERYFIDPLREATNAAHAGLRLQALGGYGDYLDVFARIDVPEAEDFGKFGATELLRLASSAAHIAGHRWASDEAFVTYARQSTALTEDDYYRMAGRAFAAGLNQLVYHGHAYPAAAPSGSKWYPFERHNITTRLDETNPVWPQLAHLNATFARLSYAMSRGQPSAQVAWLVNELRPPELDQVFGRSDSRAARYAEPYVELNPISRLLRQYAISYDRVSRRSIVLSARVCGRRLCIGSGRYDVVLVDQGAVASADWLGRLRDFAAAGIPVVVVGEEPRRARGFADTIAADGALRAIMGQLATMSAYHHVVDVDALGPALRDRIPEWVIRPASPEAWRLTSAVRTLRSEDVLFLFNGMDSAEVATFEVHRANVLAVLNPEDPDVMQRFDVGTRRSVRIVVPAGRSRIVRLLRTK